MHNEDYAVARYLSVCHTPVFCLNDYIISSIFFSPSGSPTILVFRYQTEWQYFDGDPLTGASNARGMKNHDFRPLSRFISELMQDYVWLRHFKMYTLNEMSKSLHVHGMLCNILHGAVLYLGTDARQSHSYYGRRIGNRTQAFDWSQFEWSWFLSDL